MELNRWKKCCTMNRWRKSIKYEHKWFNKWQAKAYIDIIPQVLYLFVADIMPNVFRPVSIRIKVSIAMWSWIKTNYLETLRISHCSETWSHWESSSWIAAIIFQILDIKMGGILFANVTTSILNHCEDNVYWIAYALT